MKYRVVSKTVSIESGGQPLGDDSGNLALFRLESPVSPVIQFLEAGLWRVARVGSRRSFSVSPLLSVSYNYGVVGKVGQLEAPIPRSTDSFPIFIAARDFRSGTKDFFPDLFFWYPEVVGTRLGPGNWAKLAGALACGRLPVGLLVRG